MEVVAERLAGGAVGVLEGAVLRHPEDHLAGALDEEAREAQLLLPALLLRHVAQHAFHAQDRPVVVDPQMARGLRVDDGTVELVDGHVVVADRPVFANPFDQGVAVTWVHVHGLGEVAAEGIVDGAVAEETRERGAGEHEGAGQVGAVEDVLHGLKHRAVHPLLLAHRDAVEAQTLPDHVRTDDEQREKKGDEDGADARPRDGLLPLCGVLVDPEHADGLSCGQVLDRGEARHEAPPLVGVRTHRQAPSGREHPRQAGWRLQVAGAGLRVARIVQGNAVDGEEDGSVDLLHEVEPADVGADGLHQGQLPAQRVVGHGAHVQVTCRLAHDQHRVDRTGSQRGPHLELRAPLAVGTVSCSRRHHIAARDDRREQGNDEQLDDPPGAVDEPWVGVPQQGTVVEPEPCQERDGSGHAQQLDRRAHRGAERVLVDPRRRRQRGLHGEQELQQHEDDHGHRAHAERTGMRSAAALEAPERGGAPEPAGQSQGVAGRGVDAAPSGESAKQRQSEERQQDPAADQGARPPSPS